jgi:DNA ligase-associated metallophosphoesterase
MKTVQIRDVKIQLLPEKGIFLPDLDMLAVADTHFGKAASLRHEGIVVPRGHSEDDFVRLAHLIKATRAKHLVFMGDLIHSRHSKTDLLAEMATAWRELFSDLEITLLKGNHDIASGAVPKSFGIDNIVDFLDIGDLRLQHEPEEEDGKFILAGHVHPGVSVPDRVTGRLKLPCFYFCKEYGIVPAFGSFTGLAVLPVKKDSHVYAIADGDIYKIKTNHRYR